MYEINLIDNDLNPFEKAVLDLSKMPSLTSLHLNLHEETQVDLVIKNLPNLKYLNGELIDREELQNESSAEQSFQSNQEKFNSINEVEEEQEGSEKDHPIMHMNKDAPKRELHDSSFSREDSGILDYSDSEEISLKPEDLETIALIFDKIRNMHRKNKLSNDKQMANDFDHHLKS